MLRENLKEIMCKLNFPSSSQIELLATFDKLAETDEFLNIVNRYSEEKFDFNLMLEDTKLLAESNRICTYTVHMLLLLCMLPELLRKYIEMGIDIEIFYDTMQDLRYKLEECNLVHGKCGTFVAKWYKGFFEMKIFSLGRLQFEINHTWFDCNVNGYTIPKNTKVLSVHIPRTGTPLNHDLVVDSYKKARVFFKDDFESEIIFICNSWLLYPWNRTVLHDNSNIAQFYDDFIIVQTGEYTDYSEMWRLFDCIVDGNPDNLPADTSLRRTFIERIKSGEPVGYGTGVMIVK